MIKSYRFLKHLFADSDRHRLLAKCLLSPRSIDWARCLGSDIETRLEGLCVFLEAAPHLKKLLGHHLICWSLLNSNKSDNMVQKIKTVFSVSDDLPEFIRSETIESPCRWLTVPVLLSSVHFSGNRELFHLVAGLIPGRHGGISWPLWADKLLGKDCRQALRSAENAARSQVKTSSKASIFCLPLMIEGGSKQITGPSLGLPAALAFCRLLSGKTEQGHPVLSTGAIDDHGQVYAVGNLSEKISQACESDACALIYPSENGRHLKNERIELFPVSDLSQARMFFENYLPGKKRKFTMIASMLNDAQTFVDNCPTIDSGCLSWLICEQMLEDISVQISGSRPLMNTYVEQLTRCLDDGSLEKGKLLAAVIPDTCFQSAWSNAPVSAWKLANLKLTIANHRGDIGQSRTLAEILEKRPEGLSLEDIAKCYNHKFVMMTNFYMFEPELPDEIQRVVQDLETQHAVEQKWGAIRESNLGKLYGTIAQNFAFCGPEYLEDVRQYVRLAQKTFGSGKYPEMKNDWQRSYNYLVYANLDAGQPSEAEAYLKAYLLLEPNDRLWPLNRELKEYEHAAIARFFAEQPLHGDAEAYLDWAIKSTDKQVRPRHPWQLWAYNMGRLAYFLNDKKAAETFFRKSLSVCLNPDNGETIRLMAMLPFSGLHRIEKLPELFTRNSIIKTIEKTAETVNPEYFKILAQQNFFTVMENLWKQPDMLFRFTFR